MTAPDHDPALRVIARAVRTAVLTEFAADSCIATTRVLIDTAREFGIPLRPWAANAKVFTDTAWELARAGVPLDQWPDGAWSISIDRRNSGAGVGHIVALSPARMIDASIDQTARPDRGIPELPPVLGKLPAGFDPAHPSRGELLYHGPGVWLHYEPSGSVVFRRSRNWRRDQADVRACKRLAVKAVRDQMNAAASTHV